MIMKQVLQYVFSTLMIGTFTALLAFHPLSWLSFAVAYTFWGCLLMPMLNAED